MKKIALLCMALFIVCACFTQVVQTDSADYKSLASKRLLKTGSAQIGAGVMLIAGSMGLLIASQSSSGSGAFGEGIGEMVGQMTLSIPLGIVGCMLLAKGSKNINKARLMMKEVSYTTPLHRQKSMLAFGISIPITR